VPADTLRRMAAAVAHRGPDGYGYGAGRGVGLVSTRLAIVDLDRGWQPVVTHDHRAVGVYNGEVYNAPELRRGLERRGVTLRTTCDTEVVLELLHRDGPAALDAFNGQFAVALYSPGPPARLLLARDRFGVRPLHYALLPGGDLVFASEAKGIFASGELPARLDLAGIDEVFSFWAPRPPRTAFAGVNLLAPGSLLVWQQGRIIEQRAWWQPDYTPGPASDPSRLEPLLRDAVTLRLRADVPVGTYLSGGLDSTLVTALACDAANGPVPTFSVAFDEQTLTERDAQTAAAAALGTHHTTVTVSAGDVIDAFCDTIRHAETPLVRTAPIPMLLLARGVRDAGVKVVASGEGADELWWGYDLFKEVKVRRFCARDRDSPTRPLLLDRLYPYLSPNANRRGPGWRRAFLDAGAADDPLFAYQPRFAASGAARAFYTPDTAAVIGDAGDATDRARARLPEAFSRWSALEQAAYLEVTTLLSGYLLAAQGDRVAMASGVEGRYPFLDHRLFAHARGTPSIHKLVGLREKGELRRLARRLLPETLADRPKRPYRAHDAASIIAAAGAGWVRNALEPAAVTDAGVFAPAMVATLVRRLDDGHARGQRESMALIGILSTQVLHARFCGPTRDTYQPVAAIPRRVVDIDVETRSVLVGVD
jgi:asparagine synthase (glutamine-hydrolysing)